MLSLLVTILVVALIAYICFWALGQISLPEPVRTVIVVLVAIVLILFVVKTFGLL